MASFAYPLALCNVEELVKDAVKCVAAYAHQNSDINVALTSVGLLCNTADYFHLLRFNAADHAYSPRQQQPEAQPSSLPRAVSTFHSEQFQEELEAMIFHELRLLCIDQRPEMRNSGLRTFMSALSSQGSKLPVKTWKHVVFEILLPMLQEIRQRASQSSAVEQAATELGKVRHITEVVCYHLLGLFVKFASSYLFLFVGQSDACTSQPKHRAKAMG